MSQKSMNGNWKRYPWNIAKTLPLAVMQMCNSTVANMWGGSPRVQGGHSNHCIALYCIPTKPCSKRCRGPDDVEADANQRLSYFSQMYVDDGGYDNAVNSNLFWPQCHLGRTLLIFLIQLIVLIFFSASFHILFLFHFKCILTRVPLGGLCHRGQTRIYKIWNLKYQI